MSNENGILDIAHSFGMESVKYKSISCTIEKLNPMEFSALPTSNEHNRWQQIPGYRVILKNVHCSNSKYFHSEISELISEYTKYLDSKPIFKKYKIRAHL